ncbi:MAG: VOC family protein [Patescibacteria group bacterium]
MQLNPYLNFDGNAEEAFNFYKKIFGGEFTSLMRFSDMPEGEDKPVEEEANRIMHIALPIGDTSILMASDISSANGMQLIEGNNNYITISPDSLEETERLYEQLSEGGNIEMPLQKMFWGSYFASFKDKFGIEWMIDYAESTS